MDILKLTIQGSIFIVGVIIICLILKFFKVKTCYSYFLWILVFIKLVIPISIEVPFQTVNDYMPTTHYQEHIKNEKITYQLNIEPNIKDIQSIQDIPIENINDSSLFLVAWIIGGFVLFGYQIIEYIFLIKKSKKATYLRDNVYYLENQQTFILGWIHPKIYLSISDFDESNVIYMHEKIHIHRKDYLIQFLCFFVLCIHWFNPLVWFAYYQMQKDMELSCDEKVIEILGNDRKKEYSYALLEANYSKSSILLPVSFSKNFVKQRIHHVLHYHVPKKYVGFICICCLCLCIFVMFTIQKSNYSFEKYTLKDAQRMMKYEKENQNIDDWKMVFQNLQFDQLTLTEILKEEMGGDSHEDLVIRLKSSQKLPQNIYYRYDLSMNALTVFYLDNAMNNVIYEIEQPNESISQVFYERDMFLNSTNSQLFHSPKKSAETLYVEAYKHDMKDICQIKYNQDAFHVYKLVEPYFPKSSMTFETTHVWQNDDDDFPFIYYGFYDNDETRSVGYVSIVKDLSIQQWSVYQYKPYEFSLKEDFISKKDALQKIQQFTKDILKEQALHFYLIEDDDLDNKYEAKWEAKHNGRTYSFIYNLNYNYLERFDLCEDGE